MAERVREFRSGKRCIRVQLFERPASAKREKQSGVCIYDHNPQHDPPHSVEYFSLVDVDEFWQIFRAIPPRGQIDWFPVIDWLLDHHEEVGWTARSIARGERQMLSCDTDDLPSVLTQISAILAESKKKKRRGAGHAD